MSRVIRSRKVKVGSALVALALAFGLSASWLEQHAVAEAQAGTQAPRGIEPRHRVGHRPEEGQEDHAADQPVREVAERQAQARLAIRKAVTTDAMGGNSGSSAQPSCARLFVVEMKQ